MKYIKTFENQKGQLFMDWLLKTYPDRNLKNISFINCQFQNLVNLDGIEILVNLKQLICCNNQLTKLNLENSNLEYLSCYNNKLTELNIENLFNLERLDCENNELTELNLENLVNLKLLECYDNKLPYNNLDEYNKWFEKTYPEKVAAKRYNL